MPKRTAPSTSAVGKFLALSETEKDRLLRALDAPMAISQSRRLTSAEQTQWARARRRRGRPRVGRGVRVISLSVEKELLRQSDELAKKLGVSRARIVAAGLRTILAKAG